jgi:hypothetical protein
MKGACLLVLVTVLVVPRPGKAERVAFCETRAGVCAHPKQILGTAVARGLWIVVDDQQLRAGPAGGGTAPRVIYFSRRDYDEAIAGLTASERERAVLRRLEVASENGTRLGFQVVRDDLAATAAALSRRVELDLVLEALVAISGGMKRFIDVKPAEAVSEVRRSLARLLVELPSGPAAAGYANEAKSLARLQADIRHLPAPPPPPFESPERAYFIPGMPYHPDPVDGTSYGWRGGVVSVLQPADVDEPRWKTHRPRLVYVSKPAFLHDLFTLTDAQMDRRLNARMKRVPPGEAADLRLALALSHAVLERQYGAAMNDQPSRVSQWNEALALDTENLRLLLAGTEPHAPDDLPARLAKLREDVALVSVIIRGQPNADVDASRIDQIAALVGRLPH